MNPAFSLERGVEHHTLIKGGSKSMGHPPSISYKLIVLNIGGASKHFSLQSKQIVAKRSTQFFFS